MSTYRFSTFSALCLFLIGGAAATAFAADAQPVRDQLRKTFDAGNFKDAYEGYRKLALDPNTDLMQVGEDLTMGIQSLRRLARVERSRVSRRRPSGSHQELAAAQSGRRKLLGRRKLWLHRRRQVLIAASIAAAARIVNSAERDRVRALQLLLTRPCRWPSRTTQRAKCRRFYLAFSQAAAVQPRLFRSLAAAIPERSGRAARLRRRLVLRPSQRTAAPVDAETASRSTTHVPKTLAKTPKNDGERWRWCLAQAVEMSPARLERRPQMLAEFSARASSACRRWLYYGYFFGGMRATTTARRTRAARTPCTRSAKTKRSPSWPPASSGSSCPTSSTSSRSISRSPTTRRPAMATHALQHAGRRSSRIAGSIRERPSIWRRSIKEYGPGGNNCKQQATRPDRRQLGPLRADHRRSRPARAPRSSSASATARRSQFEAHAIKVDKLLADVKAYLKTNPGQLDWQTAEHRRHRLSAGSSRTRQQYLGEQVAEWDLDLEPREKHFDKRITVTTPLQKAGAYLLTAKMDDGNISKIIVWLADTAIVKKPLRTRRFTSWPTPSPASRSPRPTSSSSAAGRSTSSDNRFQIDTLNFAEFTDADGQVMPDAQRQQPNDYQWLIIATHRRRAGFAYLGFTGVWHGNYYDHEYNQIKVFTITDRPVYRPDADGEVQVLGPPRQVRPGRHVELRRPDVHGRNPQSQGREGPRQELQGRRLRRLRRASSSCPPTPRSASVSAHRRQPAAAATFRVEEYKKPEFEVTVERRPSRSCSARRSPPRSRPSTTSARRSTNAKVKYKVLRTEHTSTWYPLGRWDWFYGRGYWWFAYDYAWYPGWQRVGLPAADPVVVAGGGHAAAGGRRRARSRDRRRRHGQGRDRHGDRQGDCIPTRITVQITAEVVDQSRRTIVGTGNVLVARKPFKVFTWVDRGYYRVGDTMQRRLQGPNARPEAGARATAS